MIAVTAHLQSLPQSPAADSNNTRARRFSHTTDGRMVLARFVHEVARLVDTQDARRCAERAEQATEWQPAFEAAVDAQRELEMAVWGEAEPLSDSANPQAQRDAWHARHAELEMLTRRLLDQARSAA